MRLICFRGNFGNIGVYYDLPEIVPAAVQGDFRVNKSGTNTIFFGVRIDTKNRLILSKNKDDNIRTFEQ